ncbi:BNR-4 repeat-containing protein [Psychrosphaera sp. B3R10]|uniref:Ig-like domain-containing protein n=1 Tax=unclassified Psychrosphaera TaxID=2641570 RepID=UPI001C08FDC2|nr:MULTISPECIES: Ig-like domain-containing protein [unclassified Psychrosphaera]MBU2883529.1 BNR-4 repeat-containing protein [Psychrosphaera sp. I2R16]MBU2989708.1 BNR-4 repeat-containing protein [Psychrosphaera sp. B3R10]
MLASLQLNAAVTLETQVKIADNGLYFDGVDLDYGNVHTANTGDKYDFFFGRSISAHGDAVKSYKHYVFMTWYRGGKDDRHVMLTRLNTVTGSTVDIEFPHQHTGFRGDPLIGESHNTIGLAVSPINGTIHMVYDMHAYDDNNHDGKFKDDFFRYSYSVAGTADVADGDFTLDKFVKDTSAVSQGENDYKHLSMTGDIADKANFARLTYPKFFATSDGTLLLYMRLGGNNNGAYLFNRYNAETETWSTFTKFNLNNQKNAGNEYNWGLYGNMKYLNGKLRVGFQQRSSDNDDKYKYQNGVYYAYSDHPEGFGEWFNHNGDPMTWPLVNSDEIKVFEPGDYISHEQPNSVYIVQDFDWTVTARGDIHIISLVQTNNSSSEAAEFGFSDIPKEKVYIHSYKPSGSDKFIIDTNFVGASSIYTAGDNIYVIGLSGGRPYIEVATGGTNKFTRVYEATDGPTFAHGTIYIKDGKVYYYLMEKGVGNSLPLYIQIIDLDISQVSVNFEKTEITLVEDYSNISLSAMTSVTDPARYVESVALYLDEELISTLNTAPYTWTQSTLALQNLTLGSYEVKAVVVDNVGDTSQAFMTVNVVESAPTVAFLTTNITLLKEYDSVDINVIADTPNDTRTISQVSLYLDETLISTKNTAPFKWSFEEPNLQNLSVGSYELKAIVKDSEGETAETTMSLTVIDPTPIVTFPQDIYTMFEGYNSFSLSVNASTPVLGRTIENVELYVDDNLIRKEAVAPYEWGHSASLSEELLNFSVGSYTIKAVATDSEGLMAEALANLIIEETIQAPLVSFNDSTQTVEEGYDSLTIDVTASSPMNTRSIKQVALFVNNVEVSTLTSAPYQWTQTDSSLTDLPVGSHVVKAVATDNLGLTAEVTMQIIVKEKVVQSQKDDLEDKPKDSDSSGGSTMPFILFMLGLFAVLRRMIMQQHLQKFKDR